MLSLSCIAQAQTPQAKIDRLTQNSGTRGQITIEMDSRSSAAISRSRTTENVAVYSINILNSSAQDGRKLADDAIKTLNKHFPEINGEWLYQAPVFKAICGHWLTRADATAVLYRLRTLFPAAFIFNNNVEIEELLKEHDVELFDMDADLETTEQESFELVKIVAPEELTQDVEI